MDKSNRPKGRQKHVTEDSRGVHKRGEGLHMDGPVGNKDGYKGRQEEYTRGEEKGIGDILGNAGAGSVEHMVEGMVIDAVAQQIAGGKRGNKKMLIIIAVIAVLLFAGGGSLFSGLLSGMGTGIPSDHTLFENGTGRSGDWSDGGKGNTGKLNTAVADGARQKRTVLKGNGKDTVTIMVYMCGTDLESKGGMATSDLQEMAAAQLADNVNLLVYTGGCTGWRNNVVSSKVNQIYQVKDGGLACLVDNAGDLPMTSPDTLTEYIKWCSKNFPANRNELIFWDHGGGSISGYGYDQKYPDSGSMNLAGINKALENAAISFDFIGFDACLMATLENGVMLSQYADYLIASEETEPGVGWYYTGWLTALSRNTSVSTPELGRQIADDFVEVCSQKCTGQQTTLSVIDLAELETIVPEALTAFSKSTGTLIKKKEYKTVSDARRETREFARSAGIDQVDLIHFAENMGTKEGKKLGKVLRSAVKYNVTSSNMTNAYGVSIYFPYKKVSSVDKMVNTYEQIGMDKEYTRCIEAFASLETGGQAVSGGTTSPLPSLLGALPGGGSSGASGTEAISELLGSLLSGGFGDIEGLGKSNTGFLDREILQESAEYLSENQLDVSQLVWSEDSDGRKKLCLKEKQWELIQSLEMNFFYDDGDGYIDLGLDNVFEFDDDGDLIGENDHTWIAVNGQPVAYYFLDETDTEDEYTINGRVPAMLNGQRVDLILTFDSIHPDGYIKGARTNYDKGETETIAKGLTDLKAGDKIDFLCDYYTYDGQFQDNYYLGEQMTVGDEMIISNVDVGGGEVQAMYRLTDIYNQHYWTPPM